MSATGRPAHPGQAGFTLLEALVTMAVLALISGLAFPTVAQGVAAVAFQQAVAGLSADLVMARAQAIRNGEPTELVVDDSGEGYGWTPGPQRGLIGGLRLSPPGGRIRFYPDGSSSGGALGLSQAGSGQASSGLGGRQARFTVDLGGAVESAR